ncbi:Abscisic acid cluster transcription factor abl7 [Pseudocercospora fuligena]|uniref:Abscisic acid cluster transcription factor abl7 n=1 Tax=Pseudocercospora fuligena TaxID=685502 RepID=A0A8H6RN93_9PEZI|nr:Abscisic acid cluster transcription factor abl7 [Pseudocercospora fuligena]
MRIIRGKSVPSESHEISQNYVTTQKWTQGDTPVEVDQDLFFGLGRMTELDSGYAEGSVLPGWDETRPAAQIVSPDNMPLDPNHDYSHTSFANQSEAMKSDLEELFFSRAYSWAPLLHKESYLAVPLHTGPASTYWCLRRAVCTVGAVTSTSFRGLGEALLRESRENLESLETGPELPWTTGNIDLAQAQSWLLLILAETICFGRQQALKSARRALPLVQQLQLRCVDSAGIAARALEEDKSSIHLEELRCTFWLAFTMDRYLAGEDDRSYVISEGMIPHTKHDFKSATPLIGLNEIFDQKCNSPFATSIALAALYGRCVTHRRLTSSFALTADEIKAFWARHDWLATAIDQQIQLQRTQASLISSGNIDSMQKFNRVMAHSLVIHLNETIRARHWDVDATKHNAIDVWHGRSKEAMKSIMQSIRDLTRLDCFVVSKAYCPKTQIMTSRTGAPSPSPTHRRFYNALLRT